MSTPKFTILLPTSIDRGLLLPYSVGSIQKQTIQDYELFIVGDGVNDFTRGVIQELRSNDDRIQFFDYPKHLPIPNNKHKINFNGKEGVVKDVLHSISNSVSEIRIICE
jgi:glycosyltransferase involved in cell wall biosynthesis